MTEVNFTSNKIWSWLPLVRGGVSRLELGLLINIGITTGEPGKVALGIIDHLFGEVSAIDLVAHKGGFLQNDAGAAEWIEQTAGFCAASGKVDEDLSELWRKHADESVAGRASLVALGIGGDILRTSRDSELIAKFYEFDMVKFFAELVMMCGSARNCGGLAWDKANIAAVALEEIFVFEGENPGGFLASFWRIIADAKSNLAFWKLAEIIGRRFIKNSRNFEGTAETIDVDIFGGYDCEIWCNLLDLTG